MTSLAIASQKGGVGKTTVALNLSLSFARRGWSTLLVDTDPMGSVGQSLRGAIQKGKGLVPYLRGESALANAVLKTRVPGFELLIAGENAMELVEGEGAAQKLQGLTKLMDEAGRAYHAIIVDTPSGIHGVTLEVLRRVAYVLVPIQAEPLALRSIRQVLDAVGKLRNEGASVTVAAFLISMLNSRNTISLDVAQESWMLLPKDLVLDAFVPRDDAFLQASAYGVPVGLLSRRPPAVASVFDQIASEMESRVGLVRKEQEHEGPIPLLD